jgi:hypothetical protein
LASILCFLVIGQLLNANTSPIAFDALFGSMDKADWEAFWEFVREQHPSLNNFSKTFITDQARGLVESVNKIHPVAGHFQFSLCLP